MLATRLALFGVLSIVALTDLAAAQCTQYTPHVMFSHDTYGFLPSTIPGEPDPRGPSNPCETMKAVTEALLGTPGLPRTSYFGTRISGLDEYSSNLVNHGAEIRVTYTLLNNTSENLASLPNDFTFWELDCTSTHVLPPSSTFTLPLACPDPMEPIVCSSYGSPIIKIASGDPQFEPPELARIRMDSATSSIIPALDICNENFRAGWIIQDECESGSLFTYPNPMPRAGANPGYTVQLATSLTVSDFHPEFKNVGMGGHVGQNYPYAASEVVAEDSWLEFAIALLDANGAGTPPSNEYDDNTFAYRITGNVVAAPGPVEVTFKFLGQADWVAPAGSGCVLPPASPPWGHYAKEGSQNDFVIERFTPSTDPLIPGTWTEVAPSAGVSKVTIPVGATHVRMRFRAIALSPVETAEIAHLHIESIVFPDSGDYGILQLGWSTDFRFLIQDSVPCPE